MLGLKSEPRYNQRTGLPKKIPRPLIPGDLKAYKTVTQATLVEIKDSLAGGKKHSSATLLRNKLRGRLMRELQDI